MKNGMYKWPRRRISKLTVFIITVVSGIIFYAFHCRWTYGIIRQFSLLDRKHTFPVEELHSSRIECTNPSIEMKVAKQILNVRTPSYKTSVTPKNKLLLLWTKFFGSQYPIDYYFFQPDSSTFVYYKCSVSNCAVTSNRSLISKADAVLFHIADFAFNNLPKYRAGNQAWIFYNLEAPSSFQKNWKRMNGLFNWTMTYREDSDITVKYGEVCRVAKPREKSHERNYLQNKTKEIAWFVSNCQASSNRSKYVEELSKYISVDIYGACGTKSCRRHRSRYCYKQISKTYKFYLAFENSICRDYVSEKLFNTLENDIIPVVMGGGDYERIAPPNSYINALDFASPKKLAEYLKNVGENDSLYNSYFDWKGKYKVYLVPWMCDLCEKLHAVRNGVSKVLHNLHEWWQEKAHCMTWHQGNRKHYFGWND